jgi:5-methylthioribose kinase
MRLTLKNISAFLMEKGLLKPKTVVDGDFVVTQSQNRNAIFRILCKQDKSLFVKQLVSFDPQNCYYLQKDATCLWLIKNEKAFQALSQYVPEYYGYDPEKQVLIVEYIPEAKDLEELYQTNKKLDEGLLDQLAKILSSFHFKLEDQTLTNRSIQFFMKQLPWTFQFAHSPTGYSTQNASMFGNNPVINYLINNQPMINVMKGLIPSYEFSSLIHGDIKSVNFIIQNVEDQDTLKIIDWELADIGDPIWDVAGIIQSLFVSKILILSAANPYGNNFQLNEEQMHQTMDEILELWTAYAKYQKFKKEESQNKLIKAIQFAGMRLVQTSFEHNMQAQQLAPKTINLLQLSHSLMQNAEHFVQQILNSRKQVYENI